MTDLLRSQTIAFMFMELVGGKKYQAPVKLVNTFNF